MGSDRHYPEEAPAHRVRVDAFTIDAVAVTNAQFAEFVRDTGIAAFTLPTTSRALDIGLIDWATFAGVLCSGITGVIQTLTNPRA